MKSGDVTRVIAMEGKCKDCKFHKNKPSKCPFYGFVGRDDKGCSDFRSKG